MRRPPPIERKAWLEAIKVFDEVHDDVERQLEEFAKEQEQESNGRDRH